jgi:hypothetical protein
MISALARIFLDSNNAASGSADVPQEPRRFHSKSKGLPQVEMRLYGVLYLMKREAEFASMTGRLDKAKSLSPRGKYHDRHELFLEQEGDEQLAVGPPRNFYSRSDDSFSVEQF